MKSMLPILPLLLALLIPNSPLLAEEEPADVSLVQLIATPEKFNGKFIRVIGFLRLEFEGNALYLHQEDFIHSIIKNAIWVGLSSKDPRQKLINNKYVILEGVFDASDHGHMGMFSGSLDKITRADFWSNPASPTSSDPKQK